MKKTRFLKWLTTIPINAEDELFFIHLRTAASQVFDYFHDHNKAGHKWEMKGENMVCPKCGREQYRFIKINSNMMWKTIQKP